MFRDPLKNAEEYEAAKQRMFELRNARFGTPEGEELDALHMLAHQFECERGDYERPEKQGVAKRWDDLCRRWYDVRLWARAKVPGLAKLEQVKYWIRAHTYNRYHVINISKIDGKRGYRWGWLDADNRMLLACMKVFCDFYEKEYPGQVLWEPTVEREFEQIYDWWKHGRFEVRDYCATLFTEGQVPDPDHWTGSRWKSEEAHKAWHDAFDAEEKRPQEMLLRLMAIRQRLWT